MERNMVNKREDRREEEDVSTTKTSIENPESKRMRPTLDDSGDDHMTAARRRATGAVDEFELASAVALASLATFSSAAPGPTGATTSVDREEKLGPTESTLIDSKNTAVPSSTGHSRTASNVSAGSMVSAEQREDHFSVELNSPSAEEPAPVTPDKSRFPPDSKAPRRVHFAPGVKEDHQQLHSMTPHQQPPYHQRRHHSAQLIQRLQLPPSTAEGERSVPPPSRLGSQHHGGSYASVYHAQPTSPMRVDVPGHTVHHHLLRSGRQHSWPRGPAPPAAFMPPPPSPVVRSFSAGSTSNSTGSALPNSWVCDYCHVASFPTYQEACMHEETCTARVPRPEGTQLPEDQNPQSQQSESAVRPWPPGAAGGISYHEPHPSTLHHHPQVGAFSPLASVSDQGRPPSKGAKSRVSVAPRKNQQTWYAGSIALGIAEKDSEWLSPLHCFVRLECIEAFSAQESDVAAASNKSRIVLHQVGIRCKFCKSTIILDNEEASGQSPFVSFPTSLAGIYEAAQRWQKGHASECPVMPAETKTKVASLESAEDQQEGESDRQEGQAESGSSSAVHISTRQYWVDSAKALGMVDTLDGIRFGRDPSLSSPDLAELEASMKFLKPRGGVGSLTATNSSDLLDGMKPAPSKGAASHGDTGDFIVFPSDAGIVPPYVYFLMRQVESCRFTEADRFVARSKGPIGYPGFQCHHCHGHAGLGKYFPVSSKSLSTNSTSQNIHAHLLKCRTCPVQVKSQLIELKEEKAKAPRLEPGWRKVFFDKIWLRLHGTDPDPK